MSPGVVMSIKRANICKKRRMVPGKYIMWFDWSLKNKSDHGFLAKEPGICLQNGAGILKGFNL